MTGLSRTITGAAFAGLLAATAALPAQAEDTIKVGILHSLSGTLAISETTLKDVMLMLIEEQNKKGGVLGRQLEPVAGMTDAETEQTAALLCDIARTHSVVVVEHDMHFVRDLGVKVTCLHEGRVLAEGSLDHVSADPRVVEVYLGR